MITLKTNYEKAIVAYLLVNKMIINTGRPFSEVKGAIKAIQKIRIDILDPFESFRDAKKSDLTGEMKKYVAKKDDSEKVLADKKAGMELIQTKLDELNEKLEKDVKAEGSVELNKDHLKSLLDCFQTLSSSQMKFNSGKDFTTGDMVNFLSFIDDCETAIAEKTTKADAK